MVAETSQPIPMIVFVINCICALIFGWQLIEIDKAKMMKIKAEREGKEKKMKNFISKQ